MTKNELKSIIKECVSEILYEDKSDINLHYSEDNLNQKLRSNGHFKKRDIYEYDKNQYDHDKSTRSLAAYHGYVKHDKYGYDKAEKNNNDEKSYFDNMTKDEIKQQAKICKDTIDNK